MKVILKAIKLIALGFLGLFIIGFIASRMEDSDNATGPVAAAVAKAAARFKTTASELAVAYDENTVAADQRFKGQRFEVSGNVDSINTDFMGRPYLTLDGGQNQFVEPQFAFGKGDTNALAKLRKGDAVTMVCTGNGDVAKTPMSEDCQLL